MSLCVCRRVVTVDWPLDRVLREGRVRARSSYAACVAGELRELGCEVLATFGVNPPHFTVQMSDSGQVAAVAAFLATRTQPNSAWKGM